jgi:hypothetical protein
LSRAIITKAHQKIQELSWEPTFVAPVDKYPTDYTFEKAPEKDPLEQVLRSSFPIEEEKDNRVFGGDGWGDPREHVPPGPAALDGVIREDTVMDEVDGQVRTYCSETCHWTDKVAFRPEYEGRPTPSMGRLAGKREWETLHHGREHAQQPQRAPEPDVTRGARDLHGRLQARRPRRPSRLEAELINGVARPLRHHDRYAEEQ